MKSCKKCLESKPLSSFYKTDKSSDGYRGVCKLCAKTHHKKTNILAGINGTIPIPQKERLCELFELIGPDLVSRTSRGCVRAGMVCGYKRKDGYLRIKVDGATVLAHRIVWKMINGDEPDYIDHINGDRADNRIENLRPVSSSENKSNEKLRINSSSGFVGVTWHTPTSPTKTAKWVVKIAKDGKEKHIGYFVELKDAVLAYNAECLILHGDYGSRKIEHNLNRLREMGL